MPKTYTTPSARIDAQRAKVAAAAIAVETANVTDLDALLAAARAGESANCQLRRAIAAAREDSNNGR